MQRKEWGAGLQSWAGRHWAAPSGLGAGMRGSPGRQAGQLREEGASCGQTRGQRHPGGWAEGRAGDGDRGGGRAGKVSVAPPPGRESGGRLCFAGATAGPGRGTREKSANLQI